MSRRATSKRVSLALPMSSPAAVPPAAVVAFGSSGAADGKGSAAADAKGGDGKAPGAAGGDPKVPGAGAGAGDSKLVSGDAAKPGADAEGDASKEREARD